MKTARTCISACFAFGLLVCWLGCAVAPEKQPGSLLSQQVRTTEDRQEAFSQDQLVQQYDQSRNQALFLAAQKRFQAGNLSEACKSLDSLLQRDPQHLEARLLRIEACLLENQLDEAKDHLLLAIELNPRHAEALRAARPMLETAGNGETAQEHRERARASRIAPAGRVSDERLAERAKSHSENLLEPPFQAQYQRHQTEAASERPAASAVRLVAHRQETTTSAVSTPPAAVVVASDAGEQDSLGDEPNRLPSLSEKHVEGKLQTPARFPIHSPEEIAKIAPADLQQIPAEVERKPAAEKISNPPQKTSQHASHAAIGPYWAEKPLISRGISPSRSARQDFTEASGLDAPENSSHPSATQSVQQLQQGEKAGPDQTARDPSGADNPTCPASTSKALPSLCSSPTEPENKPCPNLATGQKAAFSKSFPQLPKRASLLYQTALEALRRGKTDRAAEILEEGLTQFPTSYTLHRLYGVALLEGKRYEQSQIAFQQALSLDKSDALSYFLMGLALEQSGKLQQADQYFMQARSLDPTLIRSR